MARELNHSNLSLPSIPALRRKHSNIEVWDNPPADGEPPHVVVCFTHDDTWESVDITPNEARVLAAMLINAAASQESRA